MTASDDTTALDRRRIAERETHALRRMPRAFRDDAAGAAPVLGDGRSGGRDAGSPQNRTWRNPAPEEK